MCAAADYLKDNLVGETKNLENSTSTKFGML